MTDRRPAAGSDGHWDALGDEVTARLAGLAARVERDIPIATLTTYHLGGPVAVLVRVASLEALTALAPVVATYQPPLLFVGRGSNLLVADHGYPGLGIVLEEEFEAIDLVGTNAGREAQRIRAGAAVPLPVLARRAAAAGQTGLEFFVGIPGSVGGAVRMNAGGHGRATTEVLVDADVVDLLGSGDVQTRTGEQLGFGYRRSGLSTTELVVGARFRVSAAPVSECEERITEIVRWRREHQPGGANAGSVFANPPGDSAGRLIDATGLKGLRIGGATVSARHANFFQADPDATADDVYRLVREVQRRVLDAAGVRLEPELRMIGFEETADADARRGPGVRG